MMKKDIIKLLKTPWIYVFIGVYFGAALIRSNYVDIIGVEPIFTFLLLGVFLTTIVFQISKGTVINKIVIKQKGREALISMIYFFSWLGLFMIMGKLILSNHHLTNWGGLWGLLVLLPSVYLLKKGYKVSSFGLTSKHFTQNLKVTVLSCLVIGGILLFITPGGKYILNNPYFESNIKGILFASILFGIYHLPFQYYNEGLATGNFMFSLSNVLTEQMIAAPIFGILWARTQNLLAPVILHSFIDAIAIMPQIIEKYNL
jgi:membrane protease YdiL (CAAX protease family)